MPAFDNTPGAGTRVFSAGAAVRLDRAVADLFADWVWSRSAAKKLCKNQAVRLNGEIAGPSRWVTTGDEVSVIPTVDSAAVVFQLSVPVLWEDDDLAVVHKPAGIPTSGNRWRTLAHTLPFNLRGSSLPDKLLQPWPAHRLDAATSGLVVVGKTGAALAALNKAFEERRVSKCYEALVRGAVKDPELLVHAPIDGLDASTSVTVRQRVRSARCEWISWVQARPLTGRTHQIRRHLADAGHPIMGDALYTDTPPLLRGSGLYLCATGLQFVHPRSLQPLRFTLPTPNKFLSLLRRAPLAWERAQLGIP